MWKWFKSEPIEPSEYVAPDDAYGMLAEQLGYYDKGKINWESIGVTRRKFYHHQLRGAVSKYGYRTIDGEVSEDAKLESICESQSTHGALKNHVWSEDHNTILSPLNEPVWTGICVKRKELEEYIDKQKKILGEGFFIEETVKEGKVA